MKKKLTTIRTLTARLAMTLVLAMLTAATAWAQTVTVVPEDGGTYRVENGTKLYVTPATNFYLVSVTKDGVQQPLEAIAPVGEEPYYTISASDIITITFREYTNNVRVTFDLNGHSGTTPTERDYLLGQVVAQPTGIEADGNLTVCGWSTNKKGTKPYDFSTPLDNTLSYDRTNERFTLKLYAIWADASQDCTVTFNANGGTGTMDAVTQKGGSLYTIPLNGFTYDGHYLRGWATSASGSVAYPPRADHLPDGQPPALCRLDDRYFLCARCELQPLAHGLHAGGCRLYRHHLHADLARAGEGLEY